MRRRKTNDLEILFLRIPRKQKRQIEQVALEKKIDRTQAAIFLMTLGLQNHRNGLQGDILLSVEQLLVEHSKRALEDTTRLYGIVSSIYATQTMARSEQEKDEAPEGVFLLPPSPEEKKGTFFCQGCGTETSSKRKHTIKVIEDLLRVGDCCFYTDKTKELIVKMLG